MKTLDKIVNLIRISPHGLTLSSAGIILATDSIFHYVGIPNGAAGTEIIIGTIAVMVGDLYIARGEMRYRKFKKNILKEGMPEKHSIQNELNHYCNRQAFRAAAYATGFKEEFDSARNDMPKRYLQNSWMPEI